ncbi:MAG TPA: hypothetical protein VM370_05340 [Candidatus Thermoplasmatota archaeon]|nr:hypothetical protein [Candidatus Thermoplasmatota archaeon]
MKPILLLIAILLSGCATGPSVRHSCGPSVDAEGAPVARVHVYFLNDGDLDRRLCVMLNDAGPFDAVVHRANVVPNVGEIANVTIAGDALRVVAWIAGAPPHYEATGTLDGERWVVLATQRDGTLRVDVFDHQVGFA